MIGVKKTMTLSAGLAMLLAVTALPGTALARDEQQNQRFTLVATDTGGMGRLVATGPIRGVGTDALLEHTANSDGTFTDVDRFDLPSGQVFLQDTYTVQIISEPYSCKSDISVAGTYTITGGTRAYAGISGNGMFTASGIFVADRDPSGACLGFDSEPLAYVETVHGIGTTTVPSPASSVSAS